MFTRTHKLETHCQLEVPIVGKQIGDEAGSVTLHPKVIEVTLTRNSHLQADTCSILFDWRDAGVDPRFVNNAIVQLWIWDANAEDFDIVKHLRFCGVATRPARKADGSGMHVSIDFHDYTSLFIASKPYPAAAEALPNWSDTLAVAWDRICSNTGAFDIEAGKIVSTVAALKSRLEFRLSDPLRAERTLGEAVPYRFHKISKPSPPHGADSWGVWVYCCSLLGMITFVELDKVIVTDTTEYFSEDDAPTLIWGENIATVDERHDTSIAAKGMLMRSFDPTTGRLIEALYPPLGDPRIRAKRATARPPGGQPTFDDLASTYEIQNYPAIIDQTTLELRAREAWEERRRQELEGTLTTAAMQLETVTGDMVDLLDLHAGDPIRVQVDADAETLNSLNDDNDRVRYLTDGIGYSPDVAQLIVANRVRLLQPVYHVSQLQISLRPESFEARIEYHSKIHLEGIDRAA